MSGYVDIVASVEGRRESRFLLKAEGRPDAVWIVRDALTPGSQALADRAEFGDPIEIAILRDTAEGARFL